MATDHFDLPAEKQLNLPRGLRPLPVWPYAIGGTVAIITGCLVFLWAMGVFSGKKRDQVVKSDPPATEAKVTANAAEKPSKNRDISPKASPPKTETRADPIESPPKFNERVEVKTIGEEVMAKLKNGSWMMIIFSATDMLEKDTISIAVVVGTGVPDRKYDFREWRGIIRRLGRTKITDDKGNVYHPADYKSAIDGQITDLMREKFGNGMKYGSGPVFVGETRVELLRYEKPIPGVEYLDIDLEGKNIGSDEVVKFRLYSSAWKAGVE